MTDKLEMRLSDNAGTLEVTSWEDLREYISRAEAHWAWIGKISGEHAAVEVNGRIFDALRMLRNDLANHQNSGYGWRAFEPLIRVHFENPKGALLHPDSDTARAVQDVRSAVGDEAAAFAYGFWRGTVNLSHALSAADIRGAMWIGTPGYGGHSELAELLRKERENARSLVRRLAAEAEQIQRDRLTEWEKFLAHSKFDALTWAQRRSRRWRLHARRWQERHERSEKSIHSVDQLYREAMKLKGPVQYWRDKAETHRTAEESARKRLYWYFPGAFVFLILIFAVGGGVIVATPKDDLHPGALFVASAGLAAISGLLFWVGRLLTKLYLSEHHLRHDAEERAVMTTTYLALISESAADESDRQIVLNALFRSTPDGIVKEDGGLDPSIGALIAKAMVR
jgi:hypothetical protein